MNIYIYIYRHPNGLNTPLTANPWLRTGLLRRMRAGPWGPSRRVPGGRSNDGAEKGWENHGKTIKNLWKIRGFLMFLGFFGLKKISKYQVKQRHTSKIRMPCSAKKKVRWAGCWRFLQAPSQHALWQSNLDMIQLKHDPVWEVQNYSLQWYVMIERHSLSTPATHTIDMIWNFKLK